MRRVIPIVALVLPAAAAAAVHPSPRPRFHDPARGGVLRLTP